MAGSGTPPIWLGVIMGLSAVFIWAIWMPVTRLSVNAGLTPVDIAFLRFSIAGILMLPVVIRRGSGLDTLKWWQLVVLVLGAGAPYSLLAASGLRFAPAAHAGALIPGVMPLFAGLLAALFLGEGVTRLKVLGYGLILSGAFTVAGLWLPVGDSTQLNGHLLFLSAALSWASYTVVLKASKLDAIHSAALVAVGSALLIAPVFLMQGSSGFGSAGIYHIVAQGMFQGLVATILSLILFARAVAILGAARAASFGALVPVMAALMAVPMLGETPGMMESAGILAVSLGVLLISSPGKIDVAR